MKMDFQRVRKSKKGKKKKKTGFKAHWIFEEADLTRNKDVIFHNFRIYRKFWIKAVLELK